MENNNIELNEKIKANAISAYLMIFVSLWFLINKTNSNVNNSFVKAHVKSAFIIHLLFFVTYVIFISNWLFKWAYFMWIWIDYIIINSIFIFLLVLLLNWINKAKNWEYYNISKNINISKDKDIFDKNSDLNINEKEKLTLFLSLVPIIGFLNFSKYRDKRKIIENIRLNILVSVISTLLYIFNYSNLVNLLILAYTILIVFIWINLFTRNELLSIKLNKFFSPNSFYLLFISTKDYLINYFKNKEFTTLDSIIKKNEELEKKEELKNNELLKNKKELKIKYLIYIPYINLIFLFFKNTKYTFHIINAISITIILIMVQFLAYFWYINNKLYLLLIFPILFWISYLNNNRLSYKIPFFFDLFILSKWVINFIKQKLNIFNKKRNEINELKIEIK